MGYVQRMSRNLNIWVVLNESAIDGAECRNKVEGERSVIIAIGSLFDNSGLQLECVRVFHGCTCLLLCMLVRQCLKK